MNTAGDKAKITRQAPTQKLLVRVQGVPPMLLGLSKGPSNGNGLQQRYKADHHSCGAKLPELVNRQPPGDSQVWQARSYAAHNSHACSLLQVTQVHKRDAEGSHRNGPQCPNPLQPPVRTHANHICCAVWLLTCNANIVCQCLETLGTKGTGVGSLGELMLHIDVWYHRVLYILDMRMSSGPEKHSISCLMQMQK